MGLLRLPACTTGLLHVTAPPTATCHLHACPALRRAPPALHACPPLQAFAQGNIINEQLLSAFERELSASWLEIDSSGRERRISRLDDFTSQVGARRRSLPCTPPQRRLCGMPAAGCCALQARPAQLAACHCMDAA